MAFAGACTTLKGLALSSTVIVIRSSRALTVIEMQREFLASSRGQDVEEASPWRTILDISSSMQTCIANACGSGRPNSEAIDSIQLAAAVMSKEAPLKTRCQTFCGKLCRNLGIQAPNIVSIVV